MLAELHRERCSRAGRSGEMIVKEFRIKYFEKPGVALGSTLWSGSNYLCRYLSENPAEIIGKSVLELGSGIGICSILCGKLGGRVLCTDKSDTLDLIKENIKMNSVDINSQEYLWGNPSLGVFEVIIGSDIVYYDHNFQELLLALLNNSAKGSRFILAYTVRDMSEEFFFKCLESHWELGSEVPYDTYRILSYTRSH